ncbi:alanine--tRNA ligase [Clostridiisalibacter paucivorans]|uniref:alanine--tRNA ligase n=1 Tax=Clostridiisalibacter paucivorans TaxID=408753 RepID=UPI0004790F19|nr:alanine--tRNA ligase [Clostridiisalibacter paucivorans]
MKKLGLHQLRKMFLEFFQEKGHLAAKSFPLVPKDDKSLLLINAGMAPLKPYFSGAKEPPRKRMTTCQKCVRTGDIDNVGKTDRHATFFEMLGNFSFGDYFKIEAIRWAWEFMTERMEVSKEDLWVSVYKDDEEAYKIWNEQIGVPSKRIVKLGKEDNFWELETGPCGPCSEIYIDRGEEYTCGSPTCKPGCECDRYVEVWNLVFTQFEKDDRGNYTPLPNPNIDTGMGLERLAAVMNGADNIFEIEPISTILNEVEKLSGVKYGESKKDDMSIRVITDHLRAITFLVSDGVIPSNEGRGYVLRRLIRRASRHGKLLGIKDNFLYNMVKLVIDNWKEEYQELEEREVQISKIIKIEEEKFEETIDQGLNILKEYIKELTDKKLDKLDGIKAFKLYDTYGFPLDLTKEILEEEGLSIDESAFNEEMEKQRDRARKARGDSDDNGWKIEENLSSIIGTETYFKGYDKLSLETETLMIIKENEVSEELKEGEEGIIILKETPFYGESGGQIGDHGIVYNNCGKGIVKDTKKISDDKILHFVVMKNGKIGNNEKVVASVDNKKRYSIARNHSATHLLHKALKEVIGEHVNQAGSLVTDERLRFDFTHFQGLEIKEIEQIEKIVNDKIFESLEVLVLEKTLEEAKEMGATALFDEKYGDKVRTIKIGDFSMELCGGTHVNNTSEIGMFKILSESGIASGIRRIEAITGYKVYEYINDMENKALQLAELLKTNRENIVSRAKTLNQENKTLEKEIERLKMKLASSKTQDIIDSAYEVKGIKVIANRVDGMDINGLRQLGDQIKDKMGSVLIVLGTGKDNKVNFIATATQDLVKQGIHCGNIVREVAKVTHGGGGGRPNMAQAGGKDSSKIDEALSKVKGLVNNQLKI